MFFVCFCVVLFLFVSCSCEWLLCTTSSLWLFLLLVFWFCLFVGLLVGCVACHKLFMDGRRCDCCVIFLSMLQEKERKMDRAEVKRLIQELNEKDKEAET